jgi:ABC-2 type transport system permease protein
MNPMITLVRREIIEHRASWAVPMVFGGLFVLAAILAVFGLVRFGGDAHMLLSEVVYDTDPESVTPALQVMLLPVAMILNLVMAFVVAFYLLDALYAERKDRSILFWKSLPVSDLQVVLSKYLTGAVAIPLITVAVFLATALLMGLIGGAWLLWHGAGSLILTGPGALASVTLLLLYTLAFQSAWFLPVAGWLLLVSAFAKRAVLGWALLPPVLAVVAERTLLGSRHVLEMIGHRMAGGFELAFSGEHNAAFMETNGAITATFPLIGQFITPGRLLAAPSLWIGILVGVLLLAGAVWLRRWRDES